MKFHHIVEINDPLNPLADELTADQVWRGLVRRAVDPVLFVLDLDRCEITRRDDQRLERRLYFGPLVVEDEVVFEPPLRIRYRTQATRDMPAATLCMTIEQPAEGFLAVRFEYDTDVEALNPSKHDPLNDFYDGFRREAYKAADLDTIRRIRQLAQEEA